MKGNAWAKHYAQMIADRAGDKPTLEELIAEVERLRAERAAAAYDGGMRPLRKAYG